MKLFKMSLTGKRLSLLASLFITLLILVSCAPRTAKPLATPQINFTSILVEANWLTQPLSAKELVIIDVRPQNDYKLGHIPGAVNLSLSQITDAKNPVRGMLVPQEQFETVMRGAGIPQIQPGYSGRSIILDLSG
ncbi:MAG: 3-mercaptopyruvate sulfurtransferase [Dehalococcoidia bacterium]|nr:3-mercaptopyruvate sulfurtransferase [Dehalococcoidia bacterium]